MRRIQRDVCHEEFVKSLTASEGAIFKEIWRVLLFAAALGVKEGMRRPIEKVDSGKAMPESYFSSPGWRGFLYLMGIAESGDSACLRGTEDAQDGLVTAFEEYANHGLHILADRMRFTSSPLDELITLLLETMKPSTSSPIIEDLI
jgi:dnd system-associated protein 4